MLASSPIKEEGQILHFLNNVENILITDQIATPISGAYINIIRLF